MPHKHSRHEAEEAPIRNETTEPSTAAPQAIHTGWPMG